mmetsp:Transcript_439/g.1730  ORF Transcript_439/g.1730 Transcript_439/m.1730 type:complete len:235 (-) Transcript_439:123-827(-)
MVAIFPFPFPVAVAVPVPLPVPLPLHLRDVLQPPRRLHRPRLRPEGPILELGGLPDVVLARVVHEDHHGVLWLEGRGGNDVLVRRPRNASDRVSGVHNVLELHHLAALDVPHEGPAVLRPADDVPLVGGDRKPDVSPEALDAVVLPSNREDPQVNGTKVASLGEDDELPLGGHRLDARDRLALEVLVHPNELEDVPIALLPGAEEELLNHALPVPGVKVLTVDVESQGVDVTLE